METAAAIVATGARFTDGFGARRHRPGTTGPEEVLELRPELAAVPSFEFAVRERVGRLASFQHPLVSRTLRVERTPGRANALALVSDAIDGWRLSTVLDASERGTARIDLVWSLTIVRQVLDAIGALHEYDRDVVHGAIAPERIVVARGRRAFVADCALGSAIEQLHYSPQRYWTDLRVAGAAADRQFDQRHDLRQIGFVTLALLLGRHLSLEESGGQRAVIQRSFLSLMGGGHGSPLLAEACRWLGRTLEFDEPFPSASEASRQLANLIERYPKAGNLIDPLEQLEAAERESVARAPLADATRSSEPVPTVTAAPPAFAEHAATDDDSNDDPDVSAPGDVPPTAANPFVASALVRRAPFAIPRWAPYLIVAAALLAAGAGGWKYWAARHSAAQQAAASGMLSVSTPRPGVAVYIDGAKQGATPLSTRVAAGPHTLELRDGEAVRTLPITVTAGSIASQYVELSSETTSVGGLRVRTQPDGALVSIDGVPAGRSPVVLDAVKPGEHVVLVTGDFPPIKQVVLVEGGAVASLLVSRDPSAVAERTGTVAVSCPIDLQVFEKEHLIGNTAAGPLLLPPGAHDLNFLNVAFEFSGRKKVVVAAGKSTPITIDVPKGSVALNAAPWASVWLDGVSLGETPLGNIATPIGTHQVVFRHPSLGEQRRTIAVPARSVARVSVDFNAK